MLQSGSAQYLLLSEVEIISSTLLALVDLLACANVAVGEQLESIHGTINMAAGKGKRAPLPYSTKLLFNLLLFLH